MKAKYFLWLILLSTTIFCNDFTNHDLILIKKIPVGKEPGQIGYGGKITGLIAAPKCFAISKENRLYVPDVENSIIQIYDLKLNYLGNIKEISGGIHCHVTYGIKFDNNENIILFSSDFGIKKITQNGEVLFLLNKSDIPKKYALISSYHFFLIDKYLYFYDQNSYIRCIDDEGNVFGNSNSIKILDEINNKLAPAYIKKDDNIINEIKKERKKIIIGDKFYIDQQHKFRDHYKETNRNQKNKIDIDFKEIAIGRLVDYDRDHNSYWYFWYLDTKNVKEGGIVVYNNQGILIDAFYASDLMYPSDYIVSHVAISPNGDVFFMKLDGEFYYFFKIERKW